MTHVVPPLVVSALIQRDTESLFVCLFVVVIIVGASGGTQTRCSFVIKFVFLLILCTTPDLPLLSSLVVRDHYSASSDNQHPTFVLQKAAGTSKNVWGHQMDQLFTHKMSELVRVLFAVRLLATGPEVERGFAYSEVSTTLAVLCLCVAPKYWSAKMWPLKLYLFAIIARSFPDSM